MNELVHVFINVILPVFGIVAIGFLVGGKLALEARTLTRAAYYVFVPAFIFQAISNADVSLGSTIQMVVLITLAHGLVVGIAGGFGWLLGRPREVIAAFIMIAAFGNVGNYGLALIRFRLGDVAIAPATIYFVTITVFAFVVCVGAAGWAHGGRKGAFIRVLKTPALWATVPALLVSFNDLSVPLMLSRMVGLLADAMIPVMLFALGLQLLEQRRVHLSKDLVFATGIRLLLAPLIAFVVAIPFALGPIQKTAGILQAGMPVAILVAIIAKENDIVPDFVTSVVVVSTLLSLVTLSLMMVLL
ncbi:MAG: AEC family transporter [Deltaproteobacteria bacterium]|jgi:predicted permease|nr:AEC family transporter [Deltaproteobacteria bacterium]